MDATVDAVLVGAIATLVMDGFMLARRRLFGTPAPDYGPVGRWAAYLPRLKFTHDPIAATPPVPLERPIGWATHYAVGIAFAAILLAIAGPAWMQRPTIVPAMIVGIGGVLAPFLVMQPAMGAGIASRRTPNPSAARIRTLTTHAVFGLGLYLAGWAVHWSHAYSCRLFSTLCR